MEEYKPNSNLSKEQEDKRVKRVVSGPVKVKKKTGLTKFTDVFAMEDSRTVADFVIKKVLIPALKKLAYDVVMNGLNMKFFGEPSSTSSSTPKIPASKVSFGSYYDYTKRSIDEYSSQSIAYDFENVIIPDKEEAKDVLRSMYECLGEYGVVRVADFYEMVGITGPYTANRYGWTSIRKPPLLEVNGGYLINLSRPMPIASEFDRR